MADELPKIQIKGIAIDVSKLRQGFNKTREALQDLANAHGGLHQDVKDVTEQLTKLRQDIRFDLEQLGNTGTNYNPAFDDGSDATKNDDPLKEDSVKRPAESEG